MAGSALLIPTDPDAFKRNNFDAIRLAMALLVVWSHSFAIYLGTEDREPVSVLMNGTYNSGNIAVLVFFVVSGFLISHSYIRSKSLRDYLGKRIRRIYPGYFVATMIGAFIIVPLFSSRMHADFTVLEIAKSVGLNLLLRGYFPPSDAFKGGAVNGSLWSIPYEFWCYIGLATLGVAGALKGRSFCLVFTLAVMAVRVWLDLTGRHPGGGVVGMIIGYPYLWFVVLPCFMFGVCFYLYREIIPRNRWILLAGILLLVLTPNLPLDPLHAQILTNLILPPTISYMTFYTAFNRRSKLRNAARWGDFSYGTYLYAFPIQKMLFALLGLSISFPAFIVASFSFLCSQEF